MDCGAVVVVVDARARLIDKEETKNLALLPGYVNETKMRLSHDWSHFQNAQKLDFDWALAQIM